MVQRRSGKDIERFHLYDFEFVSCFHATTQSINHRLSSESGGSFRKAFLDVPLAPTSFDSIQNIKKKVPIALWPIFSLSHPCIFLKLDRRQFIRCWNLDMKTCLPTRKKVLKLSFILRWQNYSSFVSQIAKILKTSDQRATVFVAESRICRVVWALIRFDMSPSIGRPTNCVYETSRNLTNNFFSFSIFCTIHSLEPISIWSFFLSFLAFCRLPQDVAHNISKPIAPNIRWNISTFQESIHESAEIFHLESWIWISVHPNLEAFRATTD